MLNVLSPMKVVYMLKLVLVNFLASRGDPKLKKMLNNKRYALQAVADCQVVVLLKSIFHSNT